jgi:antitoxin (DNA-binding transcriptional repressor) of toxin-antitoxin stability system
MSTVSASVARQSLPTQLDRVEAGEEVAITRHGRVVAVLVRPDVLASRRASAAWSQADRIGELIDRARHEPLRPPTLAQGRADELVADLDAARSR